MKPLDIIIIVILGIGIVRGFMKGFIYEIAILGTIVVCYLLGFKLAVIIANFISGVIPVNETTMRYISLFLAWISISVGIYFLARLFEGLAEIVALGLFNKIAGALFGGMKYALILSVFLYFFNKIDFSSAWINADAKAESIFYYPLLKISTGIISELK